MKTFIIRTLLAALLAISLGAQAYADLDEAHAAYDKGNYERAFSLYRQYAEQGDADAQYALGVLYYDGQGVERDARQAAAWLKKAAEKGVAEAQLFLGNLYFEGEGVKQDYDAAAAWYGRAALKGNVDAQFNLGYMYEFGYGVPIDCDKSEAWYSKAASQGDEEAREILESFTCRDYAHVASR